jgi:spore germination protein YaaH
MTFPAARLLRILRVLTILSTLLVLALGPVASASSAPRPDAAPPPAVEAGGGLDPSIQYEEAMAHAGDRIDFQPGERVTTPFKPRAGDGWSVGGLAPRELPAGRKSGAELDQPAEIAPARGPQGAGDPATGDVDTGRLPAGSVIDARSAMATAGTSTLASPDGAASSLRREVFGFLPYWEVSDSTTTLNYSLLSTIAYFSVGADSVGNLVKTDPDGSLSTGWAGWTSSKMTSVINNAHAHGTRVVLTVSCFAWSTAQAATQSALLGSPGARALLVSQIVAAVRNRGADGVNLDFEPIASGYADEFTAFVRELRAGLDGAAPGYQLTFDATGHIGNYPLEGATAPGGADAVFIMGYDYRGTNSNPTGSISPLTGPVYDLTDTVAAYTARISPSKVILGVPYYGRAWSTPSDALHAANISGEQYGYSSTVTYTTAADYFATYGRRWDPIEGAPWTAYQRQTCTTTYGCVTMWRELYVDDAASLGLRYDLVNRSNLRGAGIWALGYDNTRPELYQVLSDKFFDDRTPPVTGVSALPASQHDEGFAVGWTGWDDTAIASWDVQVATDAGPWADWRTGVTSTSDIYLGQHGHSYAFRVRARDTRGNLGAWTVNDASPAVGPLHVGGFGRVAVDDLSMRSGPTTGASKLGSLNTGQLLSIVGGPVDADGYTWWQVTGPLTEWGAVGPVQVGAWVAATGAAAPYVEPRAAINTTTVDATIRGYHVTSSSGGRVVAPNDAVARTVQVAWSNATNLDALTLNVVGSNGTVAGSVALDRLGAGSQSWTWDGRLGGSIVPAGTYVLQLVGTVGGTTVAAPSSSPASTEQVARFGVSVDLAAGATYVALPPTRLLDSRYGNGLSGAFGAGAPRTFVVAGRGGVPAGAVAVTGNLTITGGGSAGYVALTPTPTASPSTSTLNFPAGDTRANGVTVTLGPDGTLAAVYMGPAGSAVHVIFDVTGYYIGSPAGATYVALPPTRLLDSRYGNGLSGAFGAGAPRTFVVAGRGGVPAGAVAVTGNLTITGGGSAGYVALTPTPTASPSTSTLNFPAGDTRANGVTVTLGPDGTLAAVYMGPAGSAVHVIFDVTGYVR